MEQNNMNHTKDNARKLSYQVKGKTYYIQVDDKELLDQDEQPYLEEASFIQKISESVGGAAPFLTDSMIRWILFLMPPVVFLVTILLVFALRSNI